MKATIKVKPKTESGSHTSGPWTAERSYGGMGAHWLIKGKDEYVGHFYDENGECPNGEENVELMVSAPDLLGWQQKAIPLLLAAASWMPSKKCAAHIREIEALIARAKGGAA